jgi:transcriptional regulator with XRE-family HTH domain
VEPDQAARLGALIRNRREELGLSTRQLAEQAGMNFATVARIEQGQFAAPGPDKLARIAEALGLNTADLFGLADYTVPDDLPSFQPYLRSKYRDMPSGAVEDLNKAFERIIKRHGYDPDGPRDGEDEAP